MEKYPRLRDETERILTTFLREQEQLCKEHVSGPLSLSPPPPNSFLPSPPPTAETGGADRVGLHEHQPS